MSNTAVVSYKWSEKGNQPKASPSKRYHLVFNGEIYNFKEQRSALEKKGYKFKTNTDTEVIVNLYQEYGERCVEHLRGMFAFVIWDKKERKLTAVRDRMGVKPLYYSLYNETFYFASEPKALFTAGVP